ncbi:MAG TPA: cytochrome P450, partial [Chloroflexota bacterium]|nr:cytochrome P450 [Chloroflexota bacterium]
LIQPAFHRQQLAAYSEIMVACTEQLLATWRDGEVRDIHQEMMRLTLQIVARALFGADVADEAAVVDEALRVALERFGTRLSSLAFLLPDTLPTPDNWGFLRAARRLDAIVYRIIAARRASGADRGDLLSILLRARDEADGGGMTDRQLHDEVMTLLLAGHETTAIALSWTWYLLSQHPAVEARLLAELQAVLGGRAPTAEDLPRLPYTEWVLWEALRLYPPAWALAREAVQDCEIGGYPVPAGTIVVMSQWLLHRDPRYFDAPERFLPERWADGLAKRLPRYAYFPFGGGPRLCIGAGFASLEAALVLATVLPRFRLTLVPGHPIALWPSVTLRPRYGIRMVLHRR